MRVSAKGYLFRVEFVITSKVSFFYMFQSINKNLISFAAAAVAVAFFKSKTARTAEVHVAKEMKTNSALDFLEGKKTAPVTFRDYGVPGQRTPLQV